MDNWTIKEIKPDDSRRLPDKHDLAHAVAFFLHDELSGLLRELERSDSLSVPFELREGEGEKLDGLAGEQLWEWLLRSGRADVVVDLTYRQLTGAVVADACHFLCESLLASGKGKLTVAYALLRKPFKENLLLLEWLCASPGDLLQRFNGESIDPYVLNRLPKEERLEIIRAAVTAVNLPGIDPEMLWLIRYDKKAPNSLETLWTKATHLVTSVHASAIEPGNLNFVFSQQTAIESQWDHYYSIVPVILRYFLAVAEQIAARFVVWDDELRSIQLFRRDLALLRLATRPGGSEEHQAECASTLADLAAFDFGCERCHDAMTVGEDAIDSLWLRAEVVCQSCGYRNTLWGVRGREEEEG